MDSSKCKEEFSHHEESQALEQVAQRLGSL